MTTMVVFARLVFVSIHHYCSILHRLWSFSLCWSDTHTLTHIYTATIAILEPKSLQQTDRRQNTQTHRHHTSQFEFVRLSVVVRTQQPFIISRKTNLQTQSAPIAISLLAACCSAFLSVSRIRIRPLIYSAPRRSSLVFFSCSICYT